MADRAIGHETLEVGLPNSDDRAVNDVDRAQTYEHRGEIHDNIRKESGADADHAVAAHLEQHACEHNAYSGRSVGVGIRKPRMERKHR